MESTQLAQHYDAIRRYVRRHTRTQEDADDVTQSVFAEAAVQACIAADRTPLALLYTVARRRSIDLARRQRREPSLVPLELDDCRDARGSESYSYAAEVRLVLQQAIRALPPNQRGVVVRRLVGGWSFAEIARAEGASEAACKMRFVRGLAAVRQQLEREVGGS
jgi:RNA polymerase sigma-70 factor (ECF subfamily)